jgi:hypothetical protein
VRGVPRGRVLVRAQPDLSVLVPDRAGTRMDTARRERRSPSPPAPSTVSSTTRRATRATMESLGAARGHRAPAFCGRLQASRPSLARTTSGSAPTITSRMARAMRAPSARSRAPTVPRKDSRALRSARALKAMNVYQWACALPATP